MKTSYLERTRSLASFSGQYFIINFRNYLFHFFYLFIHIYSYFVIFVLILFAVLFWGGFISHPLVHKTVSLLQPNSKFNVSGVKYLLRVEIYHECRL